MSVGEQRRGTTKEGRLTVPLKLYSTFPSGGKAGVLRYGDVPQGVSQSS